MRLKAEIWVKAYLRRCSVNGAPGFVVRRGDEDAGTILIRINRLDGASALYAPAPAGFGDVFGERRFIARTPEVGVPDGEVDAMIDKAISVDPDVWILEIEDRDGRHFLGDDLQS